MPEEQVQDEQLDDMQVFDPRIQFDSEEDKKAAQVVWSSKSIELALEAIERGLPLRANPFYDGNVALRKPNLLYKYTEDEMAEIIKCKMDILHFADQYAYLKTPEGFRPIKLRKYQRRILKNLQKNRFNILLASRQIGKTTTTSIFLAWATIFHFDKTVALLGQKASTGYEMLGKVKQIIAALPFFLKPGVHSWNAGSYMLDNGCRAITKATTLDAAQGFTIDYLYIDEFAYIKKSLENPFWENIYPTISANPNSKIIISSTPNGKNLFHKLWTNAVKGVNKFIPTKVMWWEVPGRDEEWKEQEISNIGEDAFAQQYDCSFDTAVKSLLKAHTSKYLKWTSRPFVKGLHNMGSDYEEGWSFSDLFKYNFKRDYFLISVDISEGLGKDASCIKVYKVMYGTDKKIRMISVAKFHHYKIEIEEYAKVICHMMTKFDQEKTRLIIERNTYGDQLILQMEAYARNNDDNEDLDLDIELETYAKFRRSADNPRFEKGLRLNSSNKRIGVSGFKSYMDDRLFIETDEATINEIEDFGEDDRGRFRAASGHDDQVMPIVNMAYYIKSNNYGWLDLIEEYKEEWNERSSIDVKQRDIENFEMLKKIGLWFENQITNLDSRSNDEDEDSIGFDYEANFGLKADHAPDRVPDLKGLMTSGLISIESEDFKDDLSEYDLDEAAMAEDSIYDDAYDSDFLKSSGSGNGNDLLDLF